MTIYAVLFEDNEEFAAERPRHMKAHLDFLEANKHSVTAAGPLFDPELEAGAGGLWLVEADKDEDVKALVRADPFWPTGLRKTIRILEWKQVFRDGARVINP